ncbi:MAG: 4-amino-4-deoxychorismate lyase [Sulfurimonas sp.]|uniref:aminotransferase class IV family protein n=1 Tax=Sulfurimonas sp. TaxID=2022749 RepID=UPI0039E343AE
MLKNSFLETIKSIDGRVSNISYHQKRYESVLSSLGISVYKNLQEYLHPPSSGLYRCRLVYTLDSISVTYHAYTKRDIHSLRLVYDNTIEYAKKLTARDRINELFELREECDDILIVKNGRITDTSIANVAFYKNDIWYTPASPLLRGTTRQRLLDEGFLHTADINVEDLKKYSQIALLNAMIDFDIIASISYKY